MTIEMFRDGHEWRWRLRRKRDDHEVAVSTDAVGQWTDCVYAIRELKIGVGAAPVFDTGQAPPAVVSI